MIDPVTVQAVTGAFPSTTWSEFRGDTRVVVPREQILPVLRYLRDERKFDYLVDITCVDYLHYRDALDRFGLVYLLANTASNERITVRTFLNEPELAVPSAVPLWPGANWLEREVYDMFGIRFIDHPDLRRILLPDEFTAFPLRKDYPLQGRGERHNFPVLHRDEGWPMPLTAVNTLEELVAAESRDYVWTLNFGPQHPATHTTLRLVLKLEGERIVDAIPDIGYLHSGFEKLGEDLNYNQYVTITDRMNYISPLANNVAWHGAVEKLLGLELTPRCKYLRTIVAELARISDHLLCNGAVGLDTGAFTYFLYAFNKREALYNIFESLCGARFTNSYTRVGGLMYDARLESIEMIRTFVREFPKTLDDMERLLDRNRIFVDRTKGVGILSKADAIAMSASGPIARASGVTRDLRKDEPYLAYADLDFQVCCASAGDCYARYLVRMAEMRESLKIVEQAVNNLPGGPVNVSIDERTALPTKQQVYSTIEGTISHFELLMTNRGFVVPNGEAYCATETANGELGFYLAGDGTDVAYRARCRPPSYIHFALFPQLIPGHTLSDVVAVLGSLNIIAAELDR